MVTQEKREFIEDLRSGLLGSKAYAGRNLTLWYRSLQKVQQGYDDQALPYSLIEDHMLSP
jgi:hypothetical protein